MAAASASDSKKEKPIWAKPEEEAWFILNKLKSVTSFEQLKSIVPSLNDGWIEKDPVRNPTRIKTTTSVFNSGVWTWLNHGICDATDSRGIRAYSAWDIKTDFAEYIFVFMWYEKDKNSFTVVEPLNRKIAGFPYDLPHILRTLHLFNSYSKLVSSK